VGKTKLHQQPLYLEHADAADLDRLADESKRSKQALLREAVADLFVKYRTQGFLQPDSADPFDDDRLRREVAREIRAGASIDVDALVEAGALIPKGRGWYTFKDVSVLGKVNQLVRAVQNKAVRGGKSEMQVQLGSVKRWKALAAKLKPEYR
jgi:hypothetical protein